MRRESTDIRRRSNVAVVVKAGATSETENSTSNSDRSTEEKGPRRRRRRVQLVAEPITAEAFEPFGWLVQPRGDGDGFDPSSEPRLEGFSGDSSPPSSPSSPSSPPPSTPRIYVMRLPADRGRTFRDVARHDRVTQTLGSLGRDTPWLLAVARAGVAEPGKSDLRAFSVPARALVTLRRGTWHAGPLFDAPGSREEAQGGVAKRKEKEGSGGGDAADDKDETVVDGVDFLNLELSDTNVEDRTLFDFGRGGGSGAGEDDPVEFEVLWPGERKGA